MSRLILAVLFGFASLAASAATWTAETGGYWEDDATWKDSNPPVAFENVTIAPAGATGEGNPCLRLRGDLSFGLGSLWIRNDATETWELDGAGKTFVTPDLAADAQTLYAKYPLIITPYALALGRDTFCAAYLNGYAYDQKTGWLKMENGHVVVHDDASVSGALQITLDRGAFNFHDPNGTENKQEFNIFGNGNNGAVSHGEVAVTVSGANTSVRLPTVLFKDGAHTNRFTVTDGATVWMKEGLARYGFGDLSFYEISGGATLESAGGLAIGTYPGQNARYSHHPHVVTFRDATVIGAGAVQLYGPMDVTISNVTMRASTGNEGTFTIGIGGTASTQTVSIVDSSISALNFNFSSAYLDNAVLTAEFARTTFASTRQGWTLGRGRFRIADSALTCVNTSYALSLAYEADLAFVRSTANSYRLDIGNYADAHASSKLSKVTVEDGLSSVLNVQMGKNLGAWLCVTNGGTLQVRGGNNKLNEKYIELCARSSDTSRAEQDSTVLLSDGGTLQCGLVKGGSGATVNGGNATAKIVGDGGTLQFYGGAALEGGYDFVSGLDSFELTAAGGRIDSNGYDLPVRQAFDNAAGEEGLLVKTGGGTLQLKNAHYDVARTRVEVGTLVLAETMTDFATSLEVAGGVFSLDNGIDDVLELDGLSVENGTLRLDPTDRIVVEGPVSFDGLSIEFTSAPTLDAANDILTVKGDRDPAAEQAWLLAVGANRFGDSTYVKFEAVYDAAKGETTYRATRKAESAPIDETGNVSWTGFGAWGTDANWDGGAKPTAANRAVFASETAGSPVSVAAGDTAGAIRFDAEKGYELKGDAALLMAGDQGANVLEIVKGAHVIDAPLTLASRLDVSVAPGTVLELKKPIAGGGLRKTGDGRLVVSAANEFNAGAELSGGLTLLTGEGSLHSRGGLAQNKVSLGTGTLEADVTASEAFDASLALAETVAPTDPVIVRNHGDLQTTLSSVLGGSFVKRGEGRLELSIPSELTAFPATDGVKSGNTASSTLLEFPEDGTKPTGANAYWGLNVAEGELVLKKSDSIRVTTKTGVVGMPITNCLARPVLTFDGGNWSVPFIELGNSAGAIVSSTARYPGNPMVLVTNGATVVFDSIKVGNGCWSNNEGARPELRIVGGASLQFSSAIQLLPRPDGGAAAVVTAKDSEFKFRALAMSVVDCDFDNANITYWWEGNEKNPYDAWLQFTEFAAGQLVMRNGTVLHCRGIRGLDVTHDVEFVFDDATFSIGGNTETDPRDFSACSDNLNPEHFSFVMRNRGMRLAIPEGRSFRTEVPFTGTGDLTKTGAGELQLVGDAYRFTGTLNLEGPLNLTENTATIVGARMAGSGTVNGGKFASLTIDRRAEASEGLLTLNNVQLSSRMKVDLGVNGISEPVPLFICAGTTSPSLGDCRVIGADGEKLRGKLMRNGETIVLSEVYKGGLTILVR